MLDFPYSPVSPELRSFKRFQSSLARRRKSHDAALTEKAV